MAIVMNIRTAKNPQSRQSAGQSERTGLLSHVHLLGYSLPILTMIRRHYSSRPEGYLRWAARLCGCRKEYTRSRWNMRQ